MGKSAHNDVLDGSLLVIKNNVTRQTACNAEPTTYTQAITTYMLADVTMADTDFTIADDTSGRKCTVAQKADQTIDTSGTATHIALVDVDSSTLLAVTTCTSQALTAGNTVTFPSWKIANPDPT